MQLDFLILREIYENKDTTQRSLSDAFFISLGKVNQVMKELKDKNYIDIEQVNNKNVKYKITKEGKNYLEKYKVDRCIILACGKGVRIQPLTYDTPKSLLKVKGEVLIERIINQLHERKIKDIVVMVGFYKEQFEYLIDKYNVKLVYNNEYDNKNTLATLYHASEFVEKKNCYITVSDIYQEENLFHTFECEPFYTGAFKHDLKNEWQFVTNKKNKLLYIVEGGVDAYYMVGASFFTKDFSTKFMKLINEYYKLESTDNFYWEDVLVRNLDSLPDFYVHKVREDVIHEFDNIKDYLEYNKTLNDTGSKVFSFVEKFFKIEADDMKNIECVKEGLTNRSYTFSLNDKKYIARVPGLGTSEFINRKNEVETYKKLKNKKFIENVLYIDKDGYKITEYIDDTIKTDMKDINHLKRIVDLYKKLHSSKIKVGFNNEPMNMINEYLDIMKKKNIPPLYQDFDESVEHVKKIDKFLNKNKREKVFTHGDANPGNVLLSAKNKKEDKLIDFEYAGMADPITDIALFSVYSHLNMEESLKYIKLYDEKASKKLTYIYFCYLALYGFYNAIWARVRENDGNVETGTFGMDNYHYFKTFFKYLNNNKII